VSRVINLDSAGKQRTQLVKSIVLAVRELARQHETGDEARDLAAFISMALKLIVEGIDASVAAWEKRGYWVKADRFRMEWLWAGPASEKLRAAVLKGDWPAVATISAQVAQKFGTVQVGAHHRLGKPWVGAYKQLQAR
jgi:hypothetical protein